MAENKQSIFKNSSTTFFYSSLFFPKEAWEKVATIYAYVRTADDFVDADPQDRQSFSKFVSETIIWIRLFRVIKNKNIDLKFLKISLPNSEFTYIIYPFVHLLFLEKISLSWLISFLHAMNSDLSFNNYWIKYQTRKDLENYMYGSAEVIGLMMCAILNISKKAYFYAKKQGQAMQHINFIRDITQDCKMHRLYLPEQSLSTYEINQLCNTPKTSLEIQKFSSFIRNEIEIYFQTQKESEKGYAYIPYRYRVPIATAARLYMWTAKKIYKEPTIVYSIKVKPKKMKVFVLLIWTAFREIFRK